MTMLKARQWMMALALGLLGACTTGDDAEDVSIDDEDDVGPGPDDPSDPSDPNDSSEPRQARDYLRVDVEAGPRIVGIRRVSTAAALTPVLGPDYMLAAYASGTLLSAHGVRLPVEAITEGEDEDGREWRDTSAITSGRMTLFVPADVELDRLELLSDSGEVLDARDGDDIPPAIEAGASPSPFRAAQLDAPFAHIEVLGPGDEVDLPPEIRERISEITEASPEQLATLRAGLELSAPRPLAAVRTIAVVDYAPGETALATTFGSTVIMRRTYLESAHVRATVVHESAHALHYLLDTRYTATEFDAWPAEIQAAATATVEDYLLGDSFGIVWEQMHGTAVRAGLATPYVGSAWADTSNASAVAGGFAAAYGSSVGAEDIATYVETVQTSENSRRGRGACGRFDGKSELGEADAIAYTKLTLLEGVGLITRAKFEACVGAVEFDSSPGLHFGDVLSLPQKLDAGYTNFEGTDWFAVVASDGEGYGAVLRVRSKAGRGRGVHRLDAVNFATIHSSHNALLVDHDNPIYARASGEGVVVVAEDSEDGARGVVLGLTLHNAFGEQTDYVPVTHFYVP